MEVGYKDLDFFKITFVVVIIFDLKQGAIASNEQIRLTPSIKSQKGRMWSKMKQNNTDWEVEVFVRVNGRGRIGADGMAIWYTEEIGTDGPVFGSSDNWKGLGVFLDSFDNDMQVSCGFG